MPSAKVNKVLDIGLKVFIFIAAYGFIIYELSSNHKWDTLSSFWIELKNTPFFYAILFSVFLLMLLNWTIETCKWQYLIRKKENIPFFKAFFSVLAGVTISSFVPGRMGEFVGRIFVLKKASKWKGAFISLAGSFSQLITTVIFGFFGFLFFFLNKPELREFNYLYIFTFISGVLSFGLLIIYFNFKFLQNKKRTGKRSRKYRKFLLYIKVLSSIPRKELLVALSLSCIRYIVFSSQFYILLRLCQIQLHFIEVYCLIFIIYFIMACIPSFALADLGIRGSVTIMVFKIYFSKISGDIPPVNLEWSLITASTLIWIINLLIPAIVGSFFLYKLQFFKKR